jgi:hypothetical protein
LLLRINSLNNGQSTNRRRKLMSQQMKIALTVIAAAGDGQLQKMAKVADVIEKAKAEITALGGGLTVTSDQSTYTPRPQGLSRKPRGSGQAATKTLPTGTGNGGEVNTPPTPPIMAATSEPAKANTEAAKVQADPAKPAWAGGNAQKAG